MLPSNATHKKKPAWDHLKTAHALWKSLVKPGDVVIDATCGNGHDTLILAQLALTSHSGQVFAFDVQTDAITKTQHLLQNSLPENICRRIQLIQKCHSNFPKEIAEHSVRLIVYNLGYLPAGNKAMTTFTETTLESIQQAQRLIMPEGIICITCYPGHTEGQREQHALLQYATTLNPTGWICTHQQQLNRPHSPTLLLLQSLS